MAFEDSITSSVDGEQNRRSGKALPPLIDKQSSLISLTHQSKLSSMVNSQHDYAMKWQSMREKRKELRLQKESQAEQRNLVSAFRSVTKQFEK